MAREATKLLKLLVVAAAVLVGAMPLAGCGGEGSSTPEPAVPNETRIVETTEEPARPKGYQQLFAPTMTVRKAAKPLCPRYRRLIAERAALARERLADSEGALSDPYAAADYAASTPWFETNHRTNFEGAVFDFAKARLAAVVSDDGALTSSMVSIFAKDSLWLCRQLAEYEATEKLLLDVDVRADEIEELVASMPWYPQGWYEHDENVAWRWVEDPECEYGRCWQIEVITQYGCSSGLYGEIQILEEDGTVIDYSNDALGSLEPGQMARLTFTWFSDTAEPTTGRLAEINCY